MEAGLQLNTSELTRVHKQVGNDLRALQKGLDEIDSQQRELETKKNELSARAARLQTTMEELDAIIRRLGAKPLPQTSKKASRQSIAKWPDPADSKVQLVCPFQGTSFRQQCARAIWQEITETGKRILRRHTPAVLSKRGVELPPDFDLNDISKLLSSERRVFCQSKDGWGVIAIHGEKI